MNLIPNDKAQLIALLHRQPTINVINAIKGKPATVAESIRSLKDSNVTVIIIKLK